MALSERVPHNIPTRRSASPDVPDSSETLGHVLVIHPNGEESLAVMTFRPLSLGSSEQLADVVLGDEGFQPIHVRITSDHINEFRVHGLAGPSLRPLATNVPQPDQFTIVNAGDEINLPGLHGDYRIRFLAADALADVEPSTGD
ncbi:MAG TPA: hypothetical protein QF624_11345 [Dehalococcoidia bacterium]|nr:hypothetical protein [Dehalococcoidia bacterium]